MFPTMCFLRVSMSSIFWIILNIDVVLLGSLLRLKKRTKLCTTYWKIGNENSVESFVSVSALLPLKETLLCWSCRQPHAFYISYEAELTCIGKELKLWNYAKRESRGASFFYKKKKLNKWGFWDHYGALSLLNFFLEREMACCTKNAFLCWV